MGRVRPLLLAANMPRSFYRGAGRIDRLRGTPASDDPYHPEDWIGSVTARSGAAPSGLTTLPGGALLAAAIAEDPERWLGAEHVARYGPDPAILVKLLDAGERLPLHVHPNRDFARAHLAAPYGKTEAWVVVEAAPDAVVHLGFDRDVSAGELASWVDGQRVSDMLAATNRVPVRPGDAIVCPAGVPHAIGQDIFLVEIQEPTDYSVLLEWEGYAIDGASAGHLGIGFDQALTCVDRTSWDTGRIEDLRRVRRSGRAVRPGVDRLFPELADAFFTAERLRPDPVSVLDPAFSIVVVLTGTGTLESEHGDPIEVRHGHTLLIPYAAGSCTLRGDTTAIRCRPPYAGLSG
jgi:mannose-6-phosphate isomerase